MITEGDNVSCVAFVDQLCPKTSGMTLGENLGLAPHSMIII